MSKVTTLGELDVFDHVRVLLTDDTEIEGRATAIDYVPDERLRLELRPRHSGVRYELSAEHGGSRWSPVRVRRCDTEADAVEWESLGNVGGVSVRPDTSASV
ncbi:hypothetical protein SAMN04487948_105241 [Halogranum amylolyticum]|uniref:Uncharacterized protein n=1 Tax=Halogranum amylolyticum TaxID=660520 RepID=A0A1H8SPD4_9EURY|nr:hypothetical protein [Halogranum amylolyticum]SEO80501.1 hypothetical protein SAMN04487948_105241 [Halogranum amylolyticum]